MPNSKQTTQKPVRRSKSSSKSTGRKSSQTVLDLTEDEKPRRKKRTSSKTSSSGTSSKRSSSRSKNRRAGSSSKRSSSGTKRSSTTRSSSGSRTSSTRPSSKKPAATSRKTSSTSRKKKGSSSSSRKRVAAKDVRSGTKTATKQVSSAAQARTKAARDGQQLSILDEIEAEPSTSRKKSSATSKRAKTSRSSTSKSPRRSKSTTRTRSASSRSKRSSRTGSTDRQRRSERNAGSSKRRVSDVDKSRQSSTRKSRPRAGSRPGRQSAAATLRRQRQILMPRRRTSVMNKKLPTTESGERLGWQITFVVGSLTLFGLVMVLSASSVTSLYELGDSPFFQFKRQLAWAAIGATCFIVCSRLDYRRARTIIGPLLLLCAAMMIAVLIPGVGTTAGGSTRWLGFGPFLMQPSELVKLAVIVVSADLLTRRQRRMDRPELTVHPIMFMVIFFSTLLLLQPKLGTALILGAVSFLMLFIAGASTRSLLSWAAVGTIAASILAYGASYRRARLLIFLDPWANPDGGGFQVIQSQVSIASGGWFGVGLGASRAKWGFLPTAQSDFIFAVVAEEVGLIGASALIGGFVLIGLLGFRTALAAPDRFGMLLAAGITCWILVQAFLNIGMVLSVLPTTGEPLPFVSAGGSSLMTVMAAAGILTSVARRSNP